MIPIKVKKFSYTGKDGYETVMLDFITEAERDLLIQHFIEAPVIDGFYQYHIPLADNTTGVFGTINPDLINCLKSKATQNGASNTNGSKKD